MKSEEVLERKVQNIMMSVNCCYDSVPHVNILFAVPSAEWVCLFRTYETYWFWTGRGKNEHVCLLENISDFDVSRLVSSLPCVFIHLTP